MGKKGFVSWTMILVVALIGLAVGLSLLYAIWSTGGGLTDLLVENMRGL